MNSTFLCLRPVKKQLVFLLLSSLLAFTQVKVVTVAGGYMNDGQSATNAALQVPQYAAKDSAGNVYVADYEGHRIRKISSNGVISTIAGTGISGFSGDGGSAKLAKISFPTGVVVDSSGNVVFSDTGNNRIRRISTAGVITTIAGTGAAGFSGDGGPATSAKINNPRGLRFDGQGRLFLADSSNNRIRRINLQGIIVTVAGNGNPGHTGDGGPATGATLRSPEDVVFDGAGNYYIADTYNRAIRMVNGKQIITTIAGVGGSWCDGDGGPALYANIAAPRGLLIKSGILYLNNDGCGTIRSIPLTTKVINTFAGTKPGFDGNGHLATQSLFQFYETGLLTDPAGNFLTVDSGNNEIRKINAQTHIVTAFAGGYTGDGRAGTLAALNGPADVAFDKAGNMFIADSGANRIRKLSSTGVISTFAGTGVTGYSGDGGPATSATFNTPTGVATDSLGNLYIADLGNAVVRKVDAQGIITTFARDNRFSFIISVATDASNNLYIADNCNVWQMTPAQALSNYAGEINNCGYNGDNIPATQALISPYGIAVDSHGKLYIADTTNCRVRMVDNSEIIHTVAGNGTCGFAGDGGLATAAEVNTPVGVGADSLGNVYVSDWRNLRVRLVNSQGIITTFAGTGLRGYNGNGLLATSTNIDVVTTRVNRSNVPYVVDGGPALVRKIR